MITLVKNVYIGKALPDSGGGKNKVTMSDIIIKSPTMPEASSDTVGEVRQYVGSTDVSYTHGYIYECIESTVYDGLIGFEPAKIGFDYTQGSLIEFLEGLTLNYPQVAGGVFKYDIAGDIWTINGVDSEGNTVFDNYRLYSQDLRDAGFVFLNPTEDYADGEEIDYYLTLTATSVYSWNRLDVQPGGSRGRFLALWNCATGLAESNPPTSPYPYAIGDYYIVGTVDATNYKPSGSSYVIGTASTTVETSDVAVNDTYYYDGTNWNLQKNTATTVDQTYDPASTNAQSGIAVAQALSTVSVDIDNTTITKNSSNRLQASAVMNARTGTDVIPIWQGTEQEYNQYEMISWKNWKTDTNVLQTSTVTVPFKCSSSRNRLGVKLLGGKHVASKNGFIYYSDDGVNWTNHKINANYSNDFLLEYHNGTYYAFTSSSSITRYSSTDLVNWTEGAGDGSASNAWHDICYVGNRLIGWNSGGLVVSDDNGLTWANFTPPEGGYSADTRGISYVNGIGFYSRNLDNDFNRPIDLWTSTDGATWTLASVTSGSVTAGSYKIAYGNSIYVMICTTYNYGYNAYARTSTDGINWSDVTPLNLNMGTNGLDAQAYSITFVNGRFLVACRNASVVAYSEDGETWQQANCATMDSVVYGFLPVDSNDTAVAYNFNSGTEASLSSPIILVDKKECYTLDSEPTTETVIYSEPSVESQLTVTSVGVDSITLSDGYTYNRNAGGDIDIYRNVGEVHPNYLCLINNVGIKINNISIATV